MVTPCSKARPSLLSPSNVGRDCKKINPIEVKNPGLKITFFICGMQTSPGVSRTARPARPAAGTLNHFSSATPSNECLKTWKTNTYNKFNCDYKHTIWFTHGVSSPAESPQQLAPLRGHAHQRRSLTAEEVDQRLRLAGYELSVILAGSSSACYKAFGRPKLWGLGRGNHCQRIILALSNTGKNQQHANLNAYRPVARSGWLRVPADPLGAPARHRARRPVTRDSARADDWPSWADGWETVTGTNGRAKSDQVYLWTSETQVGWSLA